LEIIRGSNIHNPRERRLAVGVARVAGLNPWIFRGWINEEMAALCRSVFTIKPFVDVDATPILFSALKEAMRKRVQQVQGL
jgi:hypothetical protein